MTVPTYEDYYVQVCDKRTRYWAEGEGAPVVLVHGCACSAEWWQYNVAPLAQGYRVYAPDLIGSGRSAKEITDPSLSYAAYFMSKFMDALGVDRATLVGNSMGGTICAQLAAQYPSRLEKFVLVDSAGFGRELHPFLRSWSVPIVGGLVFSLYQKIFPLAIRLNLLGPSSVDREWIDGATAMLRMPGVKECALKIVGEGVDLGGQKKELLDEFNSQLPDVTAPTLIIWGSHDLAVPVAHAHTAQQLIPNSRLQIMDRCGHTPQVERPEEFNQLVLDFLNEGNSEKP